jgi:uncharacterized delta-60 repeat protein
VQPNGNLLVVANRFNMTARTFLLLRYKPDGTLDTGFGNQGRAYVDLSSDVRRDALAMVGQPDGAVVVASQNVSSDSSRIQLVLMRFLASGARDLTFGSGGTVLQSFGDGASVDFGDLMLQPDGKIVVAAGSYDGSPSRVLRFRANGTLDNDFAVGGILDVPSLPKVRALGQQSDGNLIVAGSTTEDLNGTAGIVRYISGAIGAPEFYNAALDHYFLTMNPLEARDLDMGIHKGWIRTGLAFQVYGSAAAAPAGFVPVCRYYIPPDKGDSHFFSASAAECEAIAQRIATDPNYRGYVNESANAFYVALPDTTTGVCPSGTTPVFRLWNHRIDSNHRYTTDPTVKAQMIARGYIAEGYGPDAVAMCAPQ